MPINLGAMTISSSAVHLTWQPPISEQQNGIIIRYIVNVTTLETGEQSRLVSVLNQLTVHSLHPHWTYIFTVSAETSVGVGPPSLAVTATTLEDGNVVIIILIRISYSSTCIEHIGNVNILIATA